MTKRKRGLDRWTPEQVQTLYRMMEAGTMHKHIAAALGMDLMRVRHRIEFERRMGRLAAHQKMPKKSFRELLPHLPKAVVAPPSAVAERNARLRTPPRDLTAAICGDPLPGFSALERV